MEPLEEAVPERLAPEEIDTAVDVARRVARSEEHTSELQSRQYLVCRLLLEKKKQMHHILNPVQNKTQLTDIHQHYFIQSLSLYINQAHSNNSALSSTTHHLRTIISTCTPSL